MRSFIGLLFYFLITNRNRSLIVFIVLGVITVAEFVNTVMSVVEGISQHPTLLMDHGSIVMETLLPTLAELVVSQNGKYMY